jgi:hypothetical protein
VLRSRLRSLPPKALEHIARRARAVIPRLFPSETLDGHPFEAPKQFAARFLSWAESAPPEILVRALRSLSTDGGRWVRGRSRGRGKRSAARFEPQILGIVRGSLDLKPEGGRPSNDTRQELVRNLGIDWLQATGKPPEPGRSDKTGFGELVHLIFDAIDVSDDPYEAATYALRRHWGEVKRVKGRSAASVTPSHICADCKWVLRPRECDDDFFCRRLNLPCATTRRPGQECGPEGRLFELPD